MIHHKNLKKALQTRDIQRMIHDFLVDSRPDKHINSCHDAVERILFTTAKHCLKIKNIKNDILSGGFRGGPRGARPPLLLLFLEFFRLL